ncbi:MAG: Stk1 family PASTA domain-containing Ser/Thr kinase [Clostridia bacterium]|nr:Stk1 family PASTA domain-containing Ser/Thr kinase [Clostridia bacterium]
MIGMILGNRYEILREIGSGGMANVYLAHCRLLNRNVAVKVLKSEFVNDKEFLARFNKEAQVAATISSPNIVNVYDVGHDGDIHYIVMEYVEGQTLKEYIDANGMLSWQETVEYAMQICSALDKAHKNGIIHRDIKPQNIILTNDGMLKVTDFGIARATSNETTNMGESTMGSVHYFSPEQARGGYTDAKSDIYSLGIVMYELITGILPFNGDSPIAIAIKHMQTQPVSPKEFNISIPLAVEAIILKAMSKEQSLRYQSAEEMLADLNRAIQRPTERMIAPEVPVNYGNTIKMDPVNINQKPAVEVNPAEGTVRRPVHNDKKKTNTVDKQQKTKDSSKKSNTLAIVLAIVASMLFIGLGMLFAFNVFSCSGESEDYEIPDLVGMNYEEALRKYDKDNGGTFDIEVIKEKNTEKPEGEILRQSPEKGKLVKGNLKITIWVASSSDTIKVPDIMGKSKSDAEKELNKVGLVPEFKEMPVLDEKQIDKVVKTDPDTGKELLNDDNVIKVYIGVKGVKMEDLSGLKLSDAKDWLKRNKFVLGKTEPEDASDDSLVTVVHVEDKDAPDGKKIAPEGTVVAEGATVFLTLSNAEKPEEPETDNTENSKEITFRLPTDKSDVVVKVLQDGNTVHNRRHNTSEGTISMNVVKPANSNVSKIAIYFDGELSMEFDVTWR